MPTMVVFKKPSKAMPAASSQTPKSLDKTECVSNTATNPEQHGSTNKAPPAPMRYSDIAAGRDAKDDGTHIEKLMYIPELCDEVLDYLSLEELICATRVCRAFKTNIENSSRLQAKLFFAPDLTIKKKAVSTTGKLLSGLKAEQHIAAADSVEDSHSGEIALYQLHPWLQAGRLSDRYRRKGIVKFSKVYLETRSDVDEAGLCFPSNKLLAWLSNTSSLGKMFVSQPPAKEVSICYPGPGMLMETTIRNEAGVTIGEVIEAASPWSHNFPPRSTEVVLQGGFVANPRAISVAEKSGELSVEDDPTRWLLKGYEYILQDGGFAFA
jgi:hypothetical protein